MSEEMQRRASGLREKYYAGLLPLLAVHGALEAMFCDLIVCSDAKIRRQRASQIAMDYLKPDISGLLEAYEG